MNTTAVSHFIYSIVIYIFLLRVVNNVLTPRPLTQLPPDGPYLQNVVTDLAAAGLPELPASQSASKLVSPGGHCRPHDRPRGGGLEGEGMGENVSLISSDINSTVLLPSVVELYIYVFRGGGQQSRPPSLKRFFFIFFAQHVDKEGIDHSKSQILGC